jgi:hypothetical protein
MATGGVKRMALLTLFTAPKPFTNPHIAAIQVNAIRSWMALGEDIDVVVIGDEPGLEEVVCELGVPHLPNVARNEQGTPMISSIFQLAREYTSSPLLGYVNADIILHPNLLAACCSLLSNVKSFLMVGQRWDLDVTEVVDFSPGWDERLYDRAKKHGKLHTASGSDYFIFPRSCFESIPDFAVGRAGWDNWMIYHARRRGWPVVDATQDVMIIHQNHDYSHLPGGQPHYHLPETFANVRLAGGRRTIFTLNDADWRLEGGKMVRIPRRGAKLRREIEIFPLVSMKSMLLGELSFGLFHPMEALAEWRGRVAAHLAGQK